MHTPFLLPEPRLRRLGRLRSHRLAPGEPDIRGWLVIAEDGQRVGRVRDVIVDVNAGSVRYVEMELELRLTSSIAPRRIAIPIACAEVAGQRNHVNLRGVDSEELTYAPRYGARPIGPDEELAIRRFFLDGTVASADPGQGTLEEQRRFWGARRRGREGSPYVREAQSPGS